MTAPDHDAPEEIVWQGKYVTAKKRGRWEYVSRARGIRAAVILAFEAIGTASAAMEMAVGYAKDRVAFGQHLFAHGDELRHVGLAVGRFARRTRFDGKLAKQLVERLLQLRFAARIGQVGDWLALEHGVDGGDGADLELASDELLFIDIHLGKNHALVRIIGRHLSQHRRQRLARPAPFGPEIKHDELRHRRFDDIGAEAVHRLLFVEIETHARHCGILSCAFVRCIRPHVGRFDPL